MKIKKIQGIAAALLFAGYASTGLGADPDAAVPGELIVDNPTVHNLAFRWLFSGDANANATASVRYRPEGAADWLEAQPLMRVEHSGYRLPEDVEPASLLAGSILDLAPGTAYEVELAFHDPDGGAARERVTVSTRPEPVENAPGRRTLHVYPDDHRGFVREGFSSLETAMAGARPGDVILLNPGTYYGPLTVTRGGTREAPVVFRGVGEPVIDGREFDQPVIELAKGVNYVHFERLNVRSGRVGIRGVANRGIVVRRCRIEDVRYGVVTGGEPHWDQEDWYIADNVLIGRYRQWRNRVNDHFGAGIQVIGRGHVVCHNDVTFFWDGIATGHTRARDIEPDWLLKPDGPNHAIDIYNNVIRNSVDDAIEADYLFTNIRIMRNLMLNGAVGISVQPSMSGPHYIIRNLAACFSWTPWKLNVDVAGVLFYHNTTVSENAAIEQHPPALRNSRALNNIFFGRRAPSSWSAVSGPGMQNLIDYNAYCRVAMRGGEEQALFRWTDDAGKTWREFMTIGEFAAATGHERNGIFVDTEETLAGPVIHNWRDYDHYPRDIDFRQRDGSRTVNAGIRLANINDDHTGPAPDLGALEAGRPLPVYGPRPYHP